MDFKNKLIAWALLIHMIERQLKTKSLLWQSSRIFDAVKEIEFARMSSRDLVRLVELGAESRSNVRWIPTRCENFSPQAEYHDEQVFTKEMKAEIKALFYETIENIPNVTGGFDIGEFFFYLERLRLALYNCDRILGIRLGEFTY